MKLVFATVTALLLAFNVQAKQPLLTPAELSPKLGTQSLRILDIRDPKSYAENHLSGSLNAPYGKWRGPKENPGELPSLAKLTELVQSLGLSPQNHIVVVSSGADETDFGAAARVYWTLKVLGLENLSILNGGIKAWSAAKLPLDKALPTIIKSDYKPQINYALITSKEDLIRKTADGSAILVDARPNAFFKGDTRHQAAKLPGTLKGAVNLEHSKWFDASSPTFTNAEAAKKIAVNSNVSSDTEVVSFCNTGHWAATNWFALSEVAGKKNVSMYAGSMVDFTKDPNLPAMANVPNRGKQLWIDLKLWIDRTFG